MRDSPALVGEAVIWLIFILGSLGHFLLSHQPNLALKRGCQSKPGSRRC